jgi:hypothetical protein
VAEICQNRTADKGRFFRRPSVSQIEKCKTNESLDITWGICTRNRRSKYILRIFTNFYGAVQKSVSGQELPQIFLPQIRGSSWHNNEIKIIRKGHYSSNNFQDSNKRKSTEKKIMGYLPRVLFFNAFELDAESGNQVISNDEASNS